ncbi:MAG: HTH-type transcriptional regulator, dimethyl sulfoxide reductase transcription regulator [Candidatus Methanomethylophilaceae archaeon]|nr:HTH-type transcriptional regulator, dimethyl sulfoxide reductase transcription regulator [Candidatus Methanomethylophilaceae archaeon]
MKIPVKTVVNTDTFMQSPCALNCMLTVKILVMMPEGRPLCHKFLPISISDGRVSVETVRCAPSGDNSSHSLMLITASDLYNGDIGSVVRDSEDGFAHIQSISQRQSLAIVSIKGCKLSHAIAKHDSFIISSRVLSETLTEMMLLCPSNEMFGSLINAMESEGYRTKVIWSHVTKVEPLLTERQEEILKIALDAGYFNVPRKMELAELSERIGCCKSTLNTIIRKGLRAIVADYLSDKTKLLKNKEIR